MIRTNPIIRLASYARPYLRKSVLAVLMLVLVVIVELFIPQLILGLILLVLASFPLVN